MRITERDKKIITFISRHKFATVKQVSQYMEMGTKAGYRRLRKLAENYYLQYKRIFYGKPGVYLVTKKGRDVAKCEVGTQKSISLGTYHHDLKVNDMAVCFDKQGYEVITEKEIIAKVRREIGQIGKQERVPDIILQNGSGEKIAVELEIAQKGKNRIKKIVNYYIRQRKYDQVWIYCQKDSVFQKYQEFARNIEHIQVYHFEEAI